MLDIIPTYKNAERKSSLKQYNLQNAWIVNNILKLPFFNYFLNMNDINVNTISEIK